MHEVGLCKTILTIVCQKVVEKKLSCVKKIYLEIGQLASVDQSALIFSFNVISNGTAAEKAELEIIDIQGKAICDSCEKINSVNQYGTACQTCGSFFLRITEGEEFRVKSMEVE